MQPIFEQVEGVNFPRVGNVRPEMIVEEAKKRCTGLGCVARVESVRFALREPSQTEKCAFSENDTSGAANASSTREAAILRIELDMRMCAVVTQWLAATKAERNIDTEAEFLTEIEEKAQKDIARISVDGVERCQRAVERVEKPLVRLFAVNDGLNVLDQRKADDELVGIVDHSPELREKIRLRKCLQVAVLFAVVHDLTVAHRFERGAVLRFCCARAFRNDADLPMLTSVERDDPACLAVFHGLEDDGFGGDDH